MKKPTHTRCGWALCGAGNGAASSSLAQLGEEPADGVDGAEEILYCLGGRFGPREQVEQAEANHEHYQYRLDPLIHRSPPSGLLGAINT